MSNTIPFEVEHDRQLLELHRELAKAQQHVTWTFSTVKGATRPKTARYERDDRRSNTEVILDAQELRDNGDERILMYSKRPSEILDAYQAKVDAFNAVVKLIEAHEQDYTGWARFFLVTSSRGLVHSSMDCHTCNKGQSPTTFALVADFSGRPTEQLVAAVGPALCSVCFPTAPVEWQEQERISPAVATVLFDKGWDAFVEAREVSARKAAKTAETKAANAAALAARRAARAAR